MGAQTEFERKKQRHASGESTISTDSVSHYIPVPPDGGYGWVIVFAAFMNHVIVDGIAYTVGVFYMEFCDYFQEGNAKTALAGSLLAGCYMFSAPVASALVNKFGCQPVTVAGSLTATLGFLLSRFSPNVNFLIFTYGVIGGTGLGLLYLPNIVAVSYYFQERRAMATGIAVCGAGVGCFAFAPFSRFLLDVYDWKNAMTIIAGITLNGCAFGLLLRPLQPIKRAKRPRAKNIIDRLKEQTAHRMGRHRKESECSMSSIGKDREVFKRIQQIKWAKETALRELDSYSDFGSVLNSVRRLDQTETPTTDRPMPFSSSSYGCQDGISFTTPVIHENMILEIEPKVDSGQRMDSEKESLVQQEVSSNQITISPPVDAPYGERSPLMTPLTPPGQAADDQKQGSYIDSSISLSKDPTSKTDALVTRSVASRVSPLPEQKYPMCVENSLRLRLPQGIHKADYARPMYRSDIFYSGSIIQIPEYKSQPDVRNYVKSVTMIPDEIPPEDECCIWRYINMSKAAKDTLKQMTDLSLLRDPLLIVPALSNLIAYVGLYVPFIYMTGRAQSFGVPDFEAAFLLSIIGITNTVGRIIVGFMADLKWVNSLLLHNVALLIGGVSCICNMFCVTYPLMCTFAAVFGLCIATWISLTSIVLCDLLGLEKLTNAFGLLCMARGVAAMIGSPMAGMVKDLTQNFDAPFHVSGAMLLIGGLLCCLLHLPYFQNNMNCKVNEMDGNSLAAHDANDTAENTKINGTSGLPDDAPANHVVCL